jgi:hypothetical protein
MPRLNAKRLRLAWIVLTAITVIYLVIDHAAAGDGQPVSSAAVTLSAIALGLVKYRVILREFMDVRGAPMVLRRLTDLLIAVIAVALVGSYLIGRASA